MRRAIVLYNPVAGRGGALPASERACRALEAAGLAVERHATTGPGSATSLASEAGHSVDLLVVAGGDGSVREALEGLGEAAVRVPVAIIPSGNANVVARELGIPLSEGAAIEVAAQGVAVPIDIGFVGSEMFLAMVGVGWDARTTRSLATLRQTALGRAWYRLWADSAYVASGLAALLSWPPDRLELEVDGEPVERAYRAAVVANQATYGKGWSLVPSASFESGDLRFQARKRYGFPFVACQLLAGMLRRPAPAFVADYGKGQRIVIRSDRPFPVHVDGDYRGTRTSVELRVKPSGARVVAPQRHDATRAVSERLQNGGGL